MPGSPAGVLPEAVDTLTPEEKCRFCRILQLKVVASNDGIPEVSGAFGEGLVFVDGKANAE